MTFSLAVLPARWIGDNVFDVSGEESIADPLGFDDLRSPLCRDQFGLLRGIDDGSRSLSGLEGLSLLLFVRLVNERSRDHSSHSTKNTTDNDVSSSVLPISSGIGDCTDRHSAASANRAARCNALSLSCASVQN